MVEWVSAEREGAIERVDPRGRRVQTHFNDYRADVLNVIPPQKAGSLALQAGLVDESGWCPVDFRTFESLRAPGIHVIGDACKGDPMPKSAFAAYSQAKACVLAVLDLLGEAEPDAPRLINNCYSFVGPEAAISVTGVYAPSGDGRELAALSVAETPPGADWSAEAEHAADWQSLFFREVFS
jgi:sulfide dehydrogenase [flavocytochrome c] flavoprotein subunit